MTKTHNNRKTTSVSVSLSKLLALCIGLAVSAPVLAQSTTPSLGDDGAGGGTLDLGPASDDAPAQPAPQPTAQPASSASASDLTGDGPDLSNAELERTRYGSWEVACAKGGGPCVMAQIGSDSTGTPILEMVLRKLPEAQEVQGVPVVAVTDVITPLGVVLTSGLTMKIDTAEEQRAPFQICTEQGCLVREPLTEAAVDRFKKGNVAKITVVAAQQGPVSTSISLSGFTKAYNSLR